jgi:hypothetical protein
MNRVRRQICIECKGVSKLKYRILTPKTFLGHRLSHPPTPSINFRLNEGTITSFDVLEYNKFRY